MAWAVGRWAFFLVFFASTAWAGLPPPPECTGPTGTIIVNVGDNYSVNLQGVDPNGEDMTLDDTGSLPPGATLTPPSGTTSSSPFNVLLQWTPTVANAGNTYFVLINFVSVFNQPGGCEF